ncbi:MAG: CarD family transcriptional regulator [Myxococcales bacterium]
MTVISEGELKPGERVVYPNQGVCRVVGTTEMSIGGQTQVFIKLAREEDQATVMVPRGRVDKVGIRRVAGVEDIKKVFKYLGAPLEGPELDWKVRARSHVEKMSEGGILGLAQIVKGLATLADLRPLPPKERELYDNARHLLVSEIAAATELGDVSAEDAIDLALFPPGMERKKPDLAALALAAGDDELGLDLGIDEGAGFGEEESAEGEEEEEKAGGEAEEADEEAEEPEEKPKKRGRPPKAKTAAPAEAEADVEEKPKRPRGRPRKTAAPAEEAEAEPKAAKKAAEKKPAAKKAAKKTAEKKPAAKAAKKTSRTKK